MAKKTQPPAQPVLSLDSIKDLSANDTADQIGHRYSTRRVLFVEIGKLIYHLESRAKLPRGQTVYGMLKARNVPEGSVNNARMVANFIEKLVAPGHVAEARADEIITYRVANQCHRILTGKTVAKLTAEELAAVMNDGDKAAIGDELDCLAEHGLTIAGKADRDKADAEEQQRLAEQAARAEDAEKAAAEAKAARDKAEAEKAAAEARADAIAEAVASEAARETEAVATEDSDSGPEDKPEETEDESAENEPATSAPDPAPDPAPVAVPEQTPEPAPTIVDGTREFQRGKAKPDAGPVLKQIETAELASYELDTEGLAAVRAKLESWLSTIDSTLTAGKPEAVALAS